MPEPIRLASAAGFSPFRTPFDANWVVIRSKTGKPDEFDGLSTLSWVESGGFWKTVTVKAATRPGTAYLKNPMNPNGTAMIRPGRYSLSHAPGFHGERKTPAFVQVGRLSAERDNNKNIVWDPPLDPTTGKPKIWSDASGVNHHQIDDPAYLAACIGSPASELGGILEAFAFLQTKLPQSKLSLTLVEV